MVLFFKKLRFIDEIEHENEHEIKMKRKKVRIKGKKERRRRNWWNSTLNSNASRWRLDSTRRVTKGELLHNQEENKKRKEEKRERKMILKKSSQISFVNTYGDRLSSLTGKSSGKSNLLAAIQHWEGTRGDLLSGILEFHKLVFNLLDDIRIFRMVCHTQIADEIVVLRLKVSQKNCVHGLHVPHSVGWL